MSKLLTVREFMEVLGDPEAASWANEWEGWTIGPLTAEDLRAILAAQIKKAAKL